MRFDLVDLRLFIAVAEAGSISAGAESAHLALASASARIGGMEEALGTPLLTRGRRGVALTAAGSTLLHHARTVTAQVERMRGDLRAFAKGLKGNIRLLSNTAALVDIVPSALRGFLVVHPHVDVDIEEMTSADIVQAVAGKRADLGVIADSADPAGLETILLSADRLVMIAPAGHAFAKKNDIAFADLLDETFVGLRAGALHDHLAGHAARLGRRIDYRVRLQGFDTIGRLVGAGVGIGIIPWAAARTMAGAEVAIVSLSDSWAQRRLMICARRFDDLSAHARALAAEIEHKGRPVT